MAAPQVVVLSRSVGRREEDTTMARPYDGVVAVGRKKADQQIIAGGYTSLPAANCPVFACGDSLDRLPRPRGVDQSRILRRRGVDGGDSMSNIISDGDVWPEISELHRRRLRPWNWDRPLPVYRQLMEKQTGTDAELRRDQTAEISAGKDRRSRRRPNSGRLREGFPATSDGAEVQKMARSDSGK